MGGLHFFSAGLGCFEKDSDAGFPVNVGVLHIPSGKRFDEEKRFLTWEDAYKFINKWNSSGRGVWQYWIEFVPSKHSSTL